MTPLISIQNLSTRFGRQVIHQHLNLQVYGGEVLGIVGGSGSGKSVLLRIMVGLEPLQKGKIIYHRDASGHSPQMGVLFQKGALMSSLTVLENVMIPLKEMTTLPLPLIEEIARVKLALVGIEAQAMTRFPSQISGGMVKRVGLARALALDPEILFLDEPTAGLDPIAAQAFDHLIQELQAQLHITVIMVTHDLDSLVSTCDRIAVLVDRQVHVGPLEQVAQLPHPWIQDYFHGPRGERFFKQGG